MAPSQASSKKGSSANAKSANSSTRDTTTIKSEPRRSVSRHSTPVSSIPTSASSPSSTPAPPAASPPTHTPYCNTPTQHLLSQEPPISARIAKASENVAKNGDPPGARELQVLQRKIAEGIGKFMSKRGEASDRAMRQMVQKRKERAAQDRETADARAYAEAERDKNKARREEERRKKKEGEAAAHGNGKKRSHDEMDVDGADDADRKVKDALPNVGAHGVARQDGVGVGEGAEPAPPSPRVEPGTIVDDPMDTAGAMSPTSSAADSENEDLPTTAPLYERIFGKDPTQADDPIVYDIRELHDDLTDQEKREIMSVAKWPESDLRDLTAGDPPDADFSNAKPPNQVNFSTFQTYIEPYIRPFSEEDVSFLKERGDRFTPYIIPARGTKTYKEVWAAEDGEAAREIPEGLNPNEARGSMEELDDDIAEQDVVSMGPIMSRMLSLIRPQPSTRKDDAHPTNGEEANGDITMTNGDHPDTNGDNSQLIGFPSLDEPLIPSQPSSQKPFTSLLDPAARLPSTAPVPSLDYSILEDRALQELRYIGLLGPADTPAYDAHLDDEVCARLRTLQHELKRLARRNNLRRLRLLELTEERMAMQEYAHIADDLDNQVNAAYLKRNRSLAKPNHKKGGAAAAAAAAHKAGQKGVAVAGGAGRAVSDGVKALMQKRRDWINMVGPVVGYGRPPIPAEDETIFEEGEMKRLEKIEREAEAGETEGE